VRISISQSPGKVEVTDKQSISIFGL